MFPYARIDEKQIEIIHIPGQPVIGYKNMVEMVLKLKIINVEHLVDTSLMVIWSQFRMDNIDPTRNSDEMTIVKS